MGRRMSAFYSATVVRKSPVSSDGETPEGWSPREAAVVSSLISKQVVARTYRDAVQRRILSKQAALEELPSILAAYDQEVASLMTLMTEVDHDS